MCKIEALLQNADESRDPLVHGPYWVSLQSWDALGICSDASFIDYFCWILTDVRTAP